MAETATTPVTQPNPDTIPATNPATKPEAALPAAPTPEVKPATPATVISAPVAPGSAPVPPAPAEKPAEVKPADDKTKAATTPETDKKEGTTRTLTTFNYEEEPITDIVNAILLDSIKKKASDIHFDPTENGLKIRTRIDGVLFDYSLVPAYVMKNMLTRIKIISGMNITETRVPQDGAIKSSLDSINVDLRVSCLPTNIGEKIVIRILDYSMSAEGVDQLDFSEPNLKKVYSMMSKPNGIILVTGATGSGKSTTIYSILQKLNTEDRNIITVEDPVEMNIEGINQVQVMADIGLTFANVLRSILRQAPDTILIGEIRDDETARIAVRASITGHLVLSTIHTNDSLNTLERLLDMSVERYLLGAALEGVISQKLARRLCTKCSTERDTNAYEKNVFKNAINKDVTKIKTAVGCAECFSGYKGRIAIHEVLLLNQQIRDAIAKNVAKELLRDLVYSTGTITLLQDGLEKVVQGSTTFEEIIKLIDIDGDMGKDPNEKAAEAATSSETLESLDF